MPLMIFWLGALAVLLFNCAVYALFLKVVCRFLAPLPLADEPLADGPATKAPQIGYWRCLAAAIWFAMLNIAASFKLSLHLATLLEENVWASWVGQLLISLGIAAFIIHWQLRLAKGKTLLVALIWLALVGGYSVGFVMLVKSSLLEAFVMPTAAMAETVYGPNKQVPCPQCGLEFAVNCASELEKGPDDFFDEVVGCTCPNCRSHVDIGRRGLRLTCRTGDRFMANRSLLLRLAPLARWEPGVFIYPRTPPGHTAGEIRYLKRLVGLPGETIAIHDGKIYVHNGLSYASEDIAVPEEQRWQQEWMHVDDANAQEAFAQGKFQIARKSPDLIRALRRIVYDNDHQANDLRKLPARWTAEPAAGQGAWKPGGPDQPLQFEHSAGEGTMTWLRYRHQIPDAERKSARPELITDFEGYNTWETENSRAHLPRPNWVGDLLLECQLEVMSAGGVFVMELVKGSDRFQARWNLSTGGCALLRLSDGAEQTLQTAQTTINTAGSYRLRFANVDERLTVWVDATLPFGDGAAYVPSPKSGPLEQDLQPASLGGSGCAVRVSHVKLWRDTYYTDGDFFGGAAAEVDLSQPGQWQPLRERKPKTYYVQPGHYFFLGDNSAQSSDSRMWGLVPERLLLGRAFLIYYPFGRAGALK